MKAVFFLGRIHHGLKLMYLANKMNEAGIDVEILVSDNAINIDPPTEFVHQLGIPAYNHVKDYIEPKLLPETESRTAELMPYAIDAASYGVSPFWTAFSIREAAENISGMTNFLELSRPDMVFALHENNFWAKILFYLARDIKTYSLMEGIILDREEQDLGKYSIGTTYTDTLFSWSQNDAQYYSAPEHILPTGPPHMDEWIQLIADPMRHVAYKRDFRRNLGLDGSVAAFMPPRLDLYAGDFFKHLDILAKWSLSSSVGLVLRMHPFQVGAERVKEFLSKHPHVKIVEGPDGMPTIVGSDVVITQTSTVAIEAIALGTPVIQIDLDFEGLEQPLDVATYWTEGDFGTIERILAGRYNIAEYDKFRKGQLTLFDGRATERIIDYVQ